MSDSDGSVDEPADLVAADSSTENDHQQSVRGETPPEAAPRSHAGSRNPASESDVASGRRTVDTPPELVRVVVIFSTLIAIVTVLAGFMLLDAATRVVENPPASVFVGFVKAVTGLSTTGVEPYLTPVALTVGLLGLLAIGFGAWVYALGTRFRTEDGNA